MNAGGIDRVHGVYAWNDCRDDRPRQLVDDGAETSILLRRPADDGEGPHRVTAMVDLLHVQHWERVLQAVITEMIAERALGELLVRIDGAGDTEIGFGGDR